MKAVCIGGGPGGLYFGICMKLRNPDHEILVVERNKADDTFGWGVVFSDQTMERLQANDTRSADWIQSALRVSLACKRSIVWSEKTTPQPKVSSALFLSTTRISWSGFLNFMQIPKYSPPGPPPMHTAFISSSPKKSASSFQQS